jgi:hypothetical protein
MRMQSEQERLARVIDENDRTVGVLDSRRLLESLLRRVDARVL